MLIKLEDGKPIGDPITEENLKYLYPNKSFPQPIKPENVESLGYGVYLQSEPPEVGTWEKVVAVDPVKNAEGVWVETWKVEPLTPEERRDKEDGMRRMNKMTAASFLTESDWTVLPDVNLLNKSEWEAYRAKLRDIARNPPIEIAHFPAKPNENWA